VSSVTAVIFVGSKTKLAYSTLMTLSVTTNVSCVCTVQCDTKWPEFGGRWFQSAGHRTQGWTLRHSDALRKGC